MKEETRKRFLDEPSTKVLAIVLSVALVFGLIPAVCFSELRERAFAQDPVESSEQVGIPEEMANALIEQAKQEKEAQQAAEAAGEATEVAGSEVSGDPAEGNGTELTAGLVEGVVKAEAGETTVEEESDAILAAIDVAAAVSYTSKPSGGVSVSFKEGKTSYKKGETVSFAIQVNRGYLFDGPDSVSVTYLGSNTVDVVYSEGEEFPYSFLMPGSELFGMKTAYASKITVELDRVDYGISTDATPEAAAAAGCAAEIVGIAESGEPVAMEGNPTAKVGQTVSFKLVPKRGFKADAESTGVFCVTDEGELGEAVPIKDGSGTEADPFSFTMPASKVVVVGGFKEAEVYEVTGEFEHGVLNLGDFDVFEVDEQVNFQVQTDLGYAFPATVTGVFGPEAAALEGITYDAQTGVGFFTMPKGNVQLSGEIALIEYPISFTFDAQKGEASLLKNGEAFVEGDSATVNDTLSFEASAFRGFAFKSLTAPNGTKIETPAAEMPVSTLVSKQSSELALTVAFRNLVARGIDTSINEGGQVTDLSTTSDAYYEGDVVTFKVEAEYGYKVDSAELSWGKKGLLGGWTHTVACDYDEATGLYSFTMPDDSTFPSGSKTNVQLQVSMKDMRHDVKGVPFSGDGAAKGSTVAVSVDRAIAGEEVSVSATAAEGAYAAIALTCTYGDSGFKVLDTNLKGGDWTFTMPDEDVYVLVQFTYYPVTTIVPMGKGTVTINGGANERTIDTMVANAIEDISDSMTEGMSPIAASILKAVIEVALRSSIFKDLTSEGIQKLIETVLPGSIDKAIELVMNYIPESIKEQLPEGFEAQLRDKIVAGIESIINGAGDASLHYNTVPAGSEVTVTLTPEDGYAPLGIVVTRVALDTNLIIWAEKADQSTYTFTMPDDKFGVVVSGLFYKMPTWNIDATVLSGEETGSVEFSVDGVASETPGHAEATMGKTIRATVTPKHNYDIASVKFYQGDPVPFKEIEAEEVEDGIYEFTMPTCGASVYVAFKRIGANITKNVTGNGDIDVVETAAPGSDVLITPQPKEGFELLSLKVTKDDARTALGRFVYVRNNGDGTYSFRMPSGDVTVSAEFDSGSIECATIMPKPLVYNGQSQPASFVVKYKGRELVENVDYWVLGEAAAIPAGTYEAVIEGIGDFSGSKSAKWCIAPKNLADDDVEKVLDEDTFVYNGLLQAPEVSLSYNGMDLVEGIDYVLDGDLAKVNANLNGRAGYRIQLIGEGNYYTSRTCGTLDAWLEWKILPAELGKTAQVVVQDREYNGKVQATTVDVQVDGVSIPQDNLSVVAQLGRDVGAYKVKVSALACNRNVKGWQKVFWNITPKAATVTADDAQKVFGAPDPAFTFKTDGVFACDTLEDITFTRDAGEAVGDYAIHPSQLEGANKNYSLTFEDGTLTITAKPVGELTIEVGKLTYNGTEQQAPIVVKDGDKVLKLWDGETGDYWLALGQGEHAALSATDAGTYTLSVVGEGNYSGVQEDVAWTIDPKSIRGLAVTVDELTYNGAEQAVSVAVKDGETALVPWDGESGDFELIAGEGEKGAVSAKNAGTYTLRLTGVGNYCDTTDNIEWTIKPFDISNVETVEAVPIELAGPVLRANGSEQVQPFAAIVVYLLDGSTFELVEGVDFTMLGNKASDPGLYAMKVQGMNNFTGESPEKNWVILGLDSDLPTVSGAGKYVTDFQKVDGDLSLSVLSSVSDMICALVTAEEASAVTTGATIILSADLTNLGKDGSEAARAALASRGADPDAGAYYEVDFSKRIEDDAALAALEGENEELAHPAVVGIGLPSRFANTDQNVDRAYFQYEGSDAPAEMAVDYDAAQNSLSFQTEGSGTYAAGYSDTAKPQPSDNPSKDSSDKAVKTGDKGLMKIALLSLIIAGAGALMVFSLRRRDE